MSWKLTGLVSQRVCGGASRRLLLITMADKANDDGSGVYASNATLALASEISHATVKRLLKGLEDDGLISRVGMRDCRNGQTVVWQLNVEAIEALAPIGAPTGVKMNRVRGEPGSRRTRVKVNPDRGHGDPGTGVMVTHKPILKPIQEPVSVSSETLSQPVLELVGEPEPKKPKRAKTAYTPEFEAFWKLWPKNRRELSDKRTAFRRWSDAGREGIAAGEILGAARHYLAKPDVRKEDFRYCKLAEVFLNGSLEAAVEAYRDAGAANEPDGGVSEETKRKYLEVTGNWRPEWGPRPEGEGRLL